MSLRQQQNDFTQAFGAFVREADDETVDARSITLQKMCASPTEAMSSVAFSEAPILAVLVSTSARLSDNGSVQLKKIRSKRDRVEVFAEARSQKKAGTLPVWVGDSDEPTLRLFEAMFATEEGICKYIDVCILLIWASAQPLFCAFMRGFQKTVLETNGGVR